jgi:hemerythrin
MAVGGWGESPAALVESITRDHRVMKMLMDDLGGLSVPAQDDMLKAIDLVLAFAFEHCYCEEDVMRRYGYPHDAAEHMVEQHHVFMSHARALALAFCKRESPSLQPLRSFLEEFLDAHQSNEDRLLTQWLCGNSGTSGAGS